MKTFKAFAKVSTTTFANPTCVFGQTDAQITHSKTAVFNSPTHDNEALLLYPILSHAVAQ